MANRRKEANRRASGDERDSSLKNINTAMPGLGRAHKGNDRWPSGDWNDGKKIGTPSKEYDRQVPDPGRKQGSRIGNREDTAWRRRDGGFGQLDDGSGRGFGVANFRAGREGSGGRKWAGSKAPVDSTSSTPMDVLNTGESKFERIGWGKDGIGDSSTGATRKGTTGDMDSGIGTGIGVKGRP